FWLLETSALSSSRHQIHSTAVRSPRRHKSVRRDDTGAMVVLVRGGIDLACWPLVRTCRPDLAVVEEAARLQIAARRLGCSIQLRGMCTELRELLALLGLTEVVTGLRQVSGQAEGREQAGIEEVVMPDDPVA
ncbi:MAG: hypothetical protein ACRDQU_21955, partial [Pseudonocardiaceae bacterium]